MVGGWVDGGWMAGEIETNATSAQPGLGLGSVWQKADRIWEIKVNEKYSVTFCESIRNDGIQSSFAILTLVGTMTRGILNVLEMSLKNDIIDKIIA